MIGPISIRKMDLEVWAQLKAKAALAGVTLEQLVVEILRKATQ